jgi:hypothetical protein
MMCNVFLQGKFQAGKWHLGLCRLRETQRSESKLPKGILEAGTEAQIRYRSRCNERNILIRAGIFLSPFGFR